MDNTHLYLDDVESHVWSGFFDADCLQYKLEEFAQDDACVVTLQQKMTEEFAAKHAAEKTWSERTDCDEIDTVFQNLVTRGIAALQNAGYTWSDGFEDVCDMRDMNTHRGFTGYCFYHFQDTERALRGDGLTLAFGGFDPTESAAREVAEAVVEEIARTPLKPEWDGDVEKRIRIPVLTWRRRWTTNRPYWVPWARQPREIEPPSGTDNDIPGFFQADTFNPPMA